MQNSLFVPDFGRYGGRFINRRPTYQLTRPQTAVTSDSSTDEDETVPLDSDATGAARPPTQRTGTVTTLNTITSRVNDKFYAVLPHGVELKGWSEEDKLELNDHVRHMLHSRRSKFKRQMRGFGQYVRRRESLKIRSLNDHADGSSPWILCYIICRTYYTFWFSVGSFLDW